MRLNAVAAGGHSHNQLLLRRSLSTLVEQHVAFGSNCRRAGKDFRGGNVTLDSVLGRETRPIGTMI